MTARAGIVRYTRGAFMTTTRPDATGAFRLLRQRLRARRFAALDGPMRAVLLALAALLGAFTFWQVRIPFDAAHHAGGALATLRVEALALAGCAVAAGALAQWRQAVLAARVPGPEWLALPITPVFVARHLLAEARLPAMAVAPFALSIWCAGLDLLPWVWSALLLAGSMVAWLECTRLGAAFARLTAARGNATSRSLSPILRLLASGPRRGRARAVPAPRWHRGSPASALQRLDRTLSWRSAGTRARLVGALLVSGLASLAWWSGAEPLQARAQSFVGFALASALLGGWAVLRVCGDPADLIRPLPLPLRALWWARFGQLALALFVLAALQAVLANGFPIPARIGQFVTWFLPGLALATLGLHYGITLHPRSDVAENLYYGWLGVAVCASLMIPLMGWAVLLAGLIHSSLRLSRWRSPEVS